MFQEIFPSKLSLPVNYEQLKQLKQLTNQNYSVQMLSSLLLSYMS